MTGRCEVGEQEERAERKQPEPDQTQVAPGREQEEREAGAADRTARPGDLGRHFETTTSAA